MLTIVRKMFYRAPPTLPELRSTALQAARIRKFELQLEIDQVASALHACDLRIERLESELGIPEQAAKLTSLGKRATSA